MPNPFTDESRDDVWPVNVPDFVSQLRAPASLSFLRAIKPAHVRLGDQVLKATLDSYLIALIVAGQYAAVQQTLVTVFGSPVTAVTTDDNGQRKPLAKAR